MKSKSNHELMSSHDHALWIADKMHALGDYAKEAAALLVLQASKIKAFESLVSASDAALEVERIRPEFGDIIVLKIQPPFFETEVRSIVGHISRAYPEEMGVSFLLATGNVKGLERLPVSGGTVKVEDLTRILSSPLNEHEPQERPEEAEAPGLVSVHERPKK